ncbi:hypothetical protein GCM10009425_34960 [Pseudomonas asuensis]|uniref:Uncharacterized protein n=1 Tax=Pseudomonas asuensis TaxID=1825787 RepID=A0ABQ2H0X9_9PSED|nr:hypothetical protein GCM10009425_34960 [Pseudomonas asuensis]
MQGETRIEQDGATWKPTASGHDQQRPKQTQWLELYDKFITKAITLKPTVAHEIIGSLEAISGVGHILMMPTFPRMTMSIEH